MENIKEIVARNLKRFREQRGLTQRELAAELGIRHNTISSWENGTNSIDIAVLMQICDLLEVSIDQMFSKIENDSSKKELSEREQNVLSLFRRLPEEEQLKLLGRLEMLTEMSQ